MKENNITHKQQVEKTLERFDKLIEQFSEEEVLKIFDEEEKQILKKFLIHGREVKAERERAKFDGDKPDFIKLVRKWGGVKVCYRKRLTDSPAYRLNHEEIIKAFEEGIEFIENINPVEAVPDQFDAVKEIIFEKQTEENGKWKGTGETFHLPARCVLVAAGTSPNIVYEREFPDTFKMDKWKQFFFKYITYYGDNHPAYADNVVKAMASARISNLKDSEQVLRDSLWKEFIVDLEDSLKPVVAEVNRLTSTIIEIIVRAPLQARKFKPGQFYRLQNFEVDFQNLNSRLKVNSVLEKLTNN